jgi:hypothetical protein
MRYIRFLSLRRNGTRDITHLTMCVLSTSYISLHRHPQIDLRYLLCGIRCLCQSQWPRARSNAGIVGSNPTQGMDVCIVCVFSVFVLFCA